MYKCKGMAIELYGCYWPALHGIIKHRHNRSLRTSLSAVVHTCVGTNSEHLTTLKDKA